ncbi:hypothetical protein [Nocardia tengchongensis]
MLDQLFDLFVREFSKHALTLHTKPTATKAQQTRALDLVRRPVADPARFGQVVAQATALAGTYEMNP